MDTEIGEYSYSIRWIFDEKELHEIDSRTLLKSEEAITTLLYSVAKEFNFRIEIKVKPREKGSFDISHIVTILDGYKEVFMLILGAAINKFFSPNPTPKNSNVEKGTFMSECFKGINDGSLTEAQASALIENFGFTRKQKNAFYKANKSDNTIREIEVKNTDGVIAKISKEDFDDYIANQQTSEIDIHDAKVYIISPVLVPGVTEKWIGDYEGNKIRFSVKDKEFLEKSQHKIISFNTGFFIKCELRKTDKIIDGKEQTIWEVLEVTHYAVDEEHVVRFERLVKSKHKEIPGQMTLFD